MTPDEADDYEAWKTGHDLAAVRAFQKLRHEQTCVEAMLGPSAKALGMRIKVTYDHWDYAWCIDAAFVAPRVTLTLDEEMLFSGRRVMPAAQCAEMIAQEMEGLQLRLFDKAREKLQELDVRQRCYGLNDEDRHTLHDMLMDIDRNRPAWRYGAAETLAKADDEKFAKYTALVNKLFAR